MLRHTMTLALAITMLSSSIDPSKAGYLGVEVGQGALGGVRIVKVMPGSPAHQFGLQEGSEILVIDDERSISPEVFVSQVRQLMPGRWTEMVVAVGDTIVEGFVTTQDPKAAQRGEPFAVKGRGMLNIGIDDARGPIRGARITSLHRDGAGRKAGLMNGDVIVEIDGVRVTSAARAIGEISERGGKRTPMTVLRRGQAVTGVVTPELVDARGMFVVSPRAASSANGATHWCEVSSFRMAVCATGAIIVVGAMVSSGGASSDASPSNEAATRRKLREQEAQRRFELEMDDQARKDGRLPN